MGGGWNNIGVVAFFYINNFSAFPVGLEELTGKIGVPENTPPEKSWSGRVGPPAGCPALGMSGSGKSYTSTSTGWPSGCHSCPEFP